MPILDLHPSEYHARPELSASWVENAYKRSATYADWVRENPPAQSKEMLVGLAVHCLGLEGWDEYKKRYPVKGMCGHPLGPKAQTKTCMAAAKHGDGKCGTHSKDKESLLTDHLSQDQHDLVMSWLG